MMVIDSSNNSFRRSNLCLCLSRCVAGSDEDDNDKNEKYTAASQGKNSICLILPPTPRHLCTCHSFVQWPVKDRRANAIPEILLRPRECAPKITTRQITPAAQQWDRVQAADTQASRLCHTTSTLCRRFQWASRGQTDSARLMYIPLSKNNNKTHTFLNINCKCIELITSENEHYEL